MNRLLPGLAVAASALLLTLPFLGPRHHLPIATFHQEWLATALGLCLLLALLIDGRGRTWEIPRTAALPPALVGVIWLQQAVGIDALRESAILASLYLVWATLLMVAACRLETLLGRERLAGALAWSLLAGALLAAGTGAVQLWAPTIGLPWIFPSGGRVIGNLAQANNFADYLWLGVAAAVWLHVSGRLRPLPLATALLPLLGLSLLSGSRSVYFYAAALTLWLLFWSRRQTGGQRQRILRTAGLLLPVLLCLQWAIGATNPGGASVSSAQRLLASGSYDPVRLTLWQAAADIFLDHPLLGAGFDSYSREFFGRIERFPLGGIGIPEHAHNLVAEFAAELGLAGLLALFAAAGAWLFARRRVADDAGLLALGILLVLGIHSALEYPLWYANFLAIAAFMLALGDGKRWPATLNRFRHGALAGLIAFAFAALFMLQHDYARLEAATQGRHDDGMPLPPTTRSEWLAESYAHSLWRPYAALQLAAHMPLAGDDARSRLTIVEEAVRFSPIRQAVFRHAALLQLTGDVEAARRQLRRAMQAYPDEIDAARKMMEAAQADAPALAPLIEQLRQRSF